jgi:hypothetical protein
VAVSAVSAVGSTARAAEPSFAELVRLNGEAMFGGRVSVDEKEKRVVISYPGEGLFERGFDCRAGRAGAGVVSDLGRVSAGFRASLVDGGEGKFSLVGLSGGAAQSKFELGGDYTVRFKVRIPIPPARARLDWFLDRQGSRDFVQVAFFRDLVVVNGGKKRGERSSDPRTSGTPNRWFDAKSGGVPVEIVSKGGRVTVRMHLPALGDRKEGMTDLVSLDVSDGPRRGQLALSFDNVNFLLSDLSIEATLAPEWIEPEFVRLRQAGLFITEKKEEPAKEKDAPAEGDAPKTDKKKDGPDLDAPDPEADIDL